jgi:ATP-dependent Clp protease protease subunit
VLIHQPYAGAQGQVSDIELASREIQRLKAQLEQILSHHTGQDVEKIHADTDRDYVMTAQEAKEYGFIDEVIDQRDAVDNSGPIAAVK